MTVTGFNHYNLRADRATLDALRDFYVDVVGLQPGYRPPFGSYGHWLYVGSQAVLHLSEARPEEKRDATATNTFDHVAFSCTDLQATIARLQQFNIRFASDDVPTTGQHQLFFSDPAGNGVELNFGREQA
jgi:catechol-2,3-dioxygenase